MIAISAPSFLNFGWVNSMKMHVQLIMVTSTYLLFMLPVAAATTAAAAAAAAVLWWWRRYEACKRNVFMINLLIQTKDNDLLTRLDVVAEWSWRDWGPPGWWPGGPDPKNGNPAATAAP